MKATYPLLVGFGLTVSAFAQDPADAKEQPRVADAVRKAIDEFSRRKKEANAKANEVVVVLDPPAPPAIAIEEAPPASEPDSEDEDAQKPILVSGKPHEDAEEAETATANEEITGEAETADEPVAVAPAEAVPDTSAKLTIDTTLDEPLIDTPAEPSLEVRVESIRKGTGRIDPKQVKLKASFPAKPLETAPEGWTLERSEQAPVILKDVELQPGTTISLSIRPHVLAPDSDGLNTFSVGEPGFEAAHGYLQENTVSAILGTSVAQLDRDSLQLGNAISELHRLLASLPKPEEPEQSEKP